MSIFSILNHLGSFIVYYYLWCFCIFVFKVLFSGFLQFNSNFVDGQNNSKYHDCKFTSCDFWIHVQVKIYIDLNSLCKLKHIKDKLLQLNSIGCCWSDSEMEQQHTCNSAVLTVYTCRLHLNCPVHQGYKGVDFNTGISL